MRIVRFGPPGAETPGLLRTDSTGATRIVDLRALFPDIPDIDETFFSQGWLERLTHLDAPGEMIDARLGPPVARPSKIICLGKNYAEHAKEGGFEKPERPLLFCKTPNTLIGARDAICLPRSSRQVDWEVELAVVIGRKAKRVARETAFEVIAGFTVMNDVSGRDAQFADSQWFRGKAFDTFAPLGPCLATPDELGGPEGIANLRLFTKVNGEIMQDGNTRDLIFDIPGLIENISEDITLLPGDIISTGTPAGVGYFRTPPILLKAGDSVACGVEKIGTLENPVID